MLTLTLRIQGFDRELTAIGVQSSQAPATLAIATAPVSPSPPPTSPILKEHLEIASYMAHAGACFTSATIQDVRRIKFSSGAQNCSRPPDSLSGLFLQYANPLQDTYIGQWFKEVDSLDIEDGDYIIHIRVWYTQALANRDLPRSTSHENVGQVRGIEISTFRGLTKRVLCSEIDSTLDLEYYTNPLEQLVSSSLTYYIYYGINANTGAGVGWHDMELHA